MSEIKSDKYKLKPIAVKQPDFIKENDLIIYQGENDIISLSVRRCRVSGH
jgi:hypothetical protein